MLIELSISHILWGSMTSSNLSRSSLILKVVINLLSLFVSLTLSSTLVLSELRVPWR